MEGSQTYISKDMLVEVFSRLPVKSLMQLRCVCKSWSQIISSAYFVNATRKTSAKANGAYLLCTHLDFFSLTFKQEFSTKYSKYYYKPEAFELSQGCNSEGIDIYGSCNGLLCVSHSPLNITSTVYLMNPVIRKCKKISKIPVEVDECRGDPDLCFAYFDDDYEVIMITHCLSTYRVGVYSLATDTWKITDCGSTDGTIGSFGTHLSSKFVSGVAYFVKDGGTVVCFDLLEERAREIEFPEIVTLASWDSHYLFSMEACGNSIALVEIGDGNLVKWILRNCSVTNTHTWESIFIFNYNFGTYRPLYPVGFTDNSTTYVVRDDSQSGILYLCDVDRFRVLPKVHVKDVLCEEAAKEKDLLEVYPLVENLALLNEEDLDPFVEIVRVLEQIVPVKEDTKANTEQIVPSNEDTREKEVKVTRPSCIFKLFKVFKCFNTK